jgi:hypothetical protein
MIRKSSQGKFSISFGSKYPAWVFPATANIILAVSWSAAYIILNILLGFLEDEDTMGVSATASVIDWSWDAIASFWDWS